MFNLIALVVFIVAALAALWYFGFIRKRKAEKLVTNAMTKWPSGIVPAPRLPPDIPPPVSSPPTP